jgi:hypothetical protein
MTVHTGYGQLLPGFILMGAGMGLVMSPMSTAAMNAVDRTKAGVASGVLSMSRMVGGTFGVAVMGALVTTIGRSNLNSSLPHVSAAVRAKLASSLGGGAVPGQHVPANIAEAVRHAFISSLGTGLTLGAIVVVVGAVVAYRLVAPKAKLTASSPAAEQDEDQVRVEIAA